MDIIIKESGERHTLSIIDPASDVDYIQDFIGNTGALTDGQFSYSDELDAYQCDQETYDWWVVVTADHDKLGCRVARLSDQHGQEAVSAVIAGAGNDDLDVMPALINQALDEAFGVDNSHVEQWRSGMGWTQREAARQLGIALNTYQELERGQRFRDKTPAYVDRRTALAMAALDRNPDLHLGANR